MTLDNDRGFPESNYGDLAIEREAEAHRDRIASRPPFEAIMMELATSLSKRSTCRRLSVGCVIVSPNFATMYSGGYNGNARGLPNDCDSATPGACGDLHAEENAIIKCTVPEDTPKVVVVTHSPCVMCAKRLIQLGGVRRVIYGVEYRDTTSLRLLDRVGIDVRQLLTDGQLRRPKGWSDGPFTDEECGPRAPGVGKPTSRT